MFNARNQQQSTEFWRADWRFLLPDSPDFLNQSIDVIGGPADLAEIINRSVAVAGTGKTSHCASPSTTLAIMQPNDWDRAALVGSIAKATSTTMYLEGSRRAHTNWFLTPGRLRRQLVRRGFADVSLYLVAPHFGAPRRYIPLGEPGALRWYLKTLLAPASTLDTLLAAGGQLVAQLIPQLTQPLAPHFAIVASRGSRETSIPGVLVDSTVPDELRRTWSQVLLLTSGIDDGSRVVMIPFSSSSSVPRHVVKISRLPAFNRHTELDQHTLADVRARIDPALQPSLPEPLGIFHSGDLAIGVESVAPGQSISTLGWSQMRTDADKIEDLRLVGEWATRFHQQAQLRERSWSTHDMLTAFRSITAQYARSFGCASRELEMFDRLAAYLEALEPYAIPVVFQHTDLGPWNVYRAGRNLTIIDWEFGERTTVSRTGPPGSDLIWFVTHWSYAVKKLRGVGAEHRGFRDLYLNPTTVDPLILAARRELADHLRRLAVDPALFPVLLTYTWVWHALNRWERWSALGVAADTIRSKSVFNRYVGILSGTTNLAAHLERFLVDVD